MNKLNRKGFTLVELLAVIVILAIVVGITMMTVLPTLKTARQETFESSAQIVADFLEKQYQLTLVGSDLSGDTITITSIPEAATPMTSDDLTKAGVKATNYVIGSGTTWYINSATGKACVKLTASTDGQYYDVTSPTCSSGCSSCT